MPKNVTLILEYPIGDWSEQEEEGGTISTNPEDYEEYFQQADVFTCDMKIVAVKITEE